MSEELKPCPFCGAVEGDVDIHCEGKHSWYISCERCNIFLPTDAFFITREKAVTAWNTRPTIDAGELLKKSYNIINELRQFCRNNPCGDPDAECPISMGEWWGAKEEAVFRDLAQALEDKLNGGGA